MTTPNLILVGLPGAGKTSIGKRVAEQLGREFVDIDAEVERREGRSVREIFGEFGESLFRKRESAITAELAHKHGLVIAPGGGWVADPANIALLRPPGRLVYLKVRPEAALRRLAGVKGSRPLLSRPDPLAEMKRLFDERRAAYESADLAVNTELHDLQGVIAKVVELALAAG
jgi:shikimate kinase